MKKLFYLAILFLLGACQSTDCTNGVQDQGETGVDCGGPCPACSNINVSSVTPCYQDIQNYNWVASSEVDFFTSTGAGNYATKFRFTDSSFIKYFHYISGSDTLIDTLENLNIVWGLAPTWQETDSTCWYIVHVPSNDINYYRLDEEYGDSIVLYHYWQGASQNNYSDWYYKMP